MKEIRFRISTEAYQSLSEIAESWGETVPQYIARLATQAVDVRKAYIKRMKTNEHSLQR